MDGTPRIMSEIDAFLFVSHLPYAFCCSTLGGYLMESQRPKHHLDTGYSSSSDLALEAGSPSQLPAARPHWDPPLTLSCLV